MTSIEPGPSQLLGRPGAGPSARKAWAWLVASAAAGALLALSFSLQVLLGAGYKQLFSGVVASLAGAAGVGAAIGAFLALPSVFGNRLLHPSLGLWLMVLFGNVDWLGDMGGPLRWVLQGALLTLLILGAFRLRDAGGGLGLVPGAVLAAIAAVPISIAVRAHASVLAQDQWFFDDPEFRGGVLSEARAVRERQEVGELPDIWLIVADTFPSVSEAVRRGVPYSEWELARLRERGWRIHDDASTDVPNTTVTLAQTLSLSTQISNGQRRLPATSERLQVLFKQNELRWERTFSDPLLLEVLEDAGYDTWGWLGWWRAPQYLPFLHVDTSRDRFLNLLHQTVIDAWLWTHFGLWRSRRSSESGHSHASEQNCRELAAQRERFFAWDPERAPDRDPPLFVVYHLFWSHDGANIDAAGECRTDEPHDYDLTAERDDEWAAFCADLRRTGRNVMGWAPGCLRKEIQDQRAGRLNHYLTRFLARLESHALEVAGTRPFRILVFADEGMPRAASHAEYQNPSAWQIAYLVKDTGVFRAEFGSGVTRLWMETDIPDMPQAVREVVVDLVR
ncbi:MAG: hypothetical protein OXH52_23125 [Gammaproteobacteria bacterium]|nr:hypothetical protein [Gammaproteobacteria bacterium]